VREVVDELGPDLLKAPELGHVLEDDPHATHRRAPGPNDEDRAVCPTRAELARCGPGRARRRDQLLDPAIDERLERRAAAKRAGGPPEHDPRRRVRDLHDPVVVEPDDPDPHEIGEVRGVPDLLVELELRGVQAGSELPDERRQLGLRIELGARRGGDEAVGACRGRRRGPCLPGRPDGAAQDGVARRLERSLAIEGPSDGEREGDREGPDEAEEDPVHGSRIAQRQAARGTLSTAAAPDRRRRPAHPRSAADSRIGGPPRTSQDPRRTGCVFV
jgi:hypothetical protein